MDSVSLNQKVGTMVEKEFATMDEDTIIIDAVKVMRDKGISSVFVTKSKSTRKSLFILIYEFSRTKEHFLRLYQCGELVKRALRFIYMSRRKNLAASG